MRICISVGHGKSAGGGYDSGAVGGGFHEFRIARKIGFYIAEALKKYGCDTVLINYDADMYLADRIAYVNRENFDLAAEIHLNAGGGTGSEVYYKHADEEGKKLAAKISAGIAKTFSLRDRGAKTKLNSAGGDYFGFVRSVGCRSLLIETVFIDSSSDRKKCRNGSGTEKVRRIDCRVDSRILQALRKKQTAKSRAVCRYQSGRPRENYRQKLCYGSANPVVGEAQNAYRRKSRAEPRAAQRDKLVGQAL